MMTLEDVLRDGMPNKHWQQQKPKYVAEISERLEIKPETVEKMMTGNIPIGWRNAMLLSLLYSIEASEFFYASDLLEAGIT